MRYNCVSLFHRASSRKVQVMRSLSLVCFAFLLIVGPVATGQESGFPNCVEEEYIVTLDTVLDHKILQVADAAPIQSMNDLVNLAAEEIESRESRIVPVPLCAQAIALLRQDYIAGDTIGEMALDRIGLPDEANPYALRLPGREERRQADLEEVSGVETGSETAPAVREAPACSFRQNFALESLATNF